MGICNCSMFYCMLLDVHSSIAIILMGKRELVALLNLSSWCLVMVERLFLEVPQGCLQFVIVVFPDHTLLLIFMNEGNQSNTLPDPRWVDQGEGTRLLSPFARCTLGLNRHSPAIFIKINYGITVSMTQGFTSRKYLVNFQKLDFLRFLTINSATTGERDLNWTSQISLPTHHSNR